MRKRVRRGDIWFLDTPEGVGCEQQGDRVFLVVSTNLCHEKSDLVIGLLGTKYENKEGTEKLQDTQLTITTDYGLKYDTVFMAEQILRIDRQRLMMYCTHVDDYKMQDANKAMCVALGMLEPINNKYIKLLIDYISMLGEHDKLREEKLKELDDYCKEYGYDHKVFLQKYQIYKEVELVG